MSQTTIGKDGSLRVIPIAVQEDAERRARQVYAGAPWLMHLGPAAESIVRADVTHVKRLAMLRKLADRVYAAVKGQSACTNGCSACCHIRVEVTQWEADLIGREIGVKPVDLSSSKYDMVRPGEEDPRFGRPCVFLKDGACGIYDARPLTCRLHHNLAPDASQCQLDVDPKESMVPAIDVTAISGAYMLASGWSMKEGAEQPSVHALEDYFPTGLGG